ncbi:unnamed protein product [Ranitomeya imitator]|uniref:Uncharacterized protein n=1 Tax=Ranitomeya imitator TaxID=111125 RepID=A0ABN9KT96_9NEOB|nr:unnamed protein product [Ranitomeya imitator]
MDYAVPRYELPSRHFFSRKAIPALHQHVKERIVHALRQSVSTKVHLTTDAWTSRHGQGRYVSITAHWVNVVDAGSTGDSKFGTVLPSPRSRKQLAVAVRTPPSSSSSSSCRSETSSTDRSRTTTPSAAATVAHQVSHYGAATGKRQQAVLAMKCLGDNRHTAEVLSEFLQKETQSWLGTVDLEAGKLKPGGRIRALNHVDLSITLQQRLSMMLDSFDYKEERLSNQKKHYSLADLDDSKNYGDETREIQTMNAKGLHNPDDQLNKDLTSYTQLPQNVIKELNQVLKKSRKNKTERE